MARAAPPAISLSAALSTLISPMPGFGAGGCGGSAAAGRGRSRASTAARPASAPRTIGRRPSARSRTGSSARHCRHFDVGDRIEARAGRRPHGAAAEQFLQQRDDRHDQQRGDEGRADDRHDLREIGLGRRDGAGEDARIGRQIAAVLARRCLAVARQVGFQQLALGGRLALQRAQLDLVVAGARRRRLRRVEVGDQLLLADTARSAPASPGPSAPSAPRRGSARRGRRAASAARGCADGCRAASSKDRRCRPSAAPGARAAAGSARTTAPPAAHRARRRSPAPRARSAAVASAAPRLARTRDSSVDSSDKLLRGQHRIVLPDQQVRLRAEGGDLASASLTRLLRSAISGASQSVASAFDCSLAPRCTDR